MNNRKQHFSFLLLLLSLLFAAPAYAQDQKTTEAAAKLRAMFFARDFEAGYLEGRKLAEQYPDSVAVKVWLILNASRIDRANEALEMAEKLKAADDKNGWGWFAYAGALHYQDERTKETLAASETMLSLLPGNDDALWLRATILRQKSKPEDAIAFIEKNITRTKNPAELLVVKALALFTLYTSQQPDREEAKLQAALNAFGEAIKADPANVNAHYSQASSLLSLKRNAEALTLLKQALQLSPYATTVHREYWRALMGVPDLTAEARQKLIEDDINALMQSRGNYLNTIQTFAGPYEALKLADKKKELEERILQLGPQSPEAEWVRVSRLRQFSSDMYQDKKVDDSERAAYIKMLRDYINQPRHFNKFLLGENYRNLFQMLKEDPASTNADLLAAMKGMLQYEKSNIHLTYPWAAITMAERKINFREAESLAREGIVEAKKKVDSQKEFYKTDADYEKAVNYLTAKMYDALGWVFFHEGRLGEAEKELLHAHSLNGDDLDVTLHLGKFYQSKKDYPKAEEFFIKGSLIATPGTNPNVEALKTLYETRNGNLKGYDAYMAKLGEKDTVNRKARVIGDRLKEPKALAAFNLKTLDGKTLSSADLKGKVVVINYWGIWCGWCVEEMPEFQLLHEKYKNDADVVILTINNDQNPADVPPWMKKNKYGFNVLFDDGYVSKASITSFPTTWFLDKDGRIAFIKVGWTKRLTEEFSWRIEALKASGAATN